MTANHHRLLTLLVLLFWQSACAGEEPPLETDDLDGDGSLNEQDCGPTDPEIYPGAEDPFGDGIDQDCDGGDGIDNDGDSYPANDDLTNPGLYDCDDENASINPGTIEMPYDGIDNDCDGEDADDLDDDGYAAQEVGGPDCDDQDPSIHPGWQVPDPAGLLSSPLTTDIIDLVDNDCDGSVDEGPFSRGFAVDIQPIFTANCTANQCHHAPAGQAGLSLDEGVASDNLLRIPSTQSELDRITPLEPLSSYVWHKLNATQLEVGGLGESMPFDQPQLSQEQLLSVYLWILEGCP
jgi:hypothetical protein